MTRTTLFRKVSIQPQEGDSFLTGISVRQYKALWSTLAFEGNAMNLFDIENVKLIETSARKQYFSEMIMFCIQHIQKM